MRWAVLADIHGNHPALKAVMADMNTRRIDAALNLGDCVSGPLWPQETLALLRAAGWPTVRGNHDRWVGTDSIDTLDPFDRYAAEALSAEDRDWLRDCPATLELPGGLLAMHARPTDDNAYLLEDRWGERLVLAEPDVIRGRLGAIDVSLVLTAHSHLARYFTLPHGPAIVNPGSVGCPAYDDDSTDPPHIAESGSPAARYAVIETNPQGLMVELLSIPYPHEVAAVQAEAHGRPDWAHALRTGFALHRRGPL